MNDLNQALAQFKEQMSNIAALLNEAAVITEIELNGIKIPIKPYISQRMKAQAIEILSSIKVKHFQAWAADLENLRLVENTNYFNLTKHVTEMKEQGLPYTQQDVDSFFFNTENFVDKYDVKERDRCNIELFKLIADDKQLKTEEKKKFNSDTDSKFWQDVDMLEVERAVTFFRKKSAI